MGKKRIVKKADGAEGSVVEKTASSSKKKVESGVLQVQSTYNNTKLILTDMKGNTLAWSTSGALGFKGAKKGTPFAAAKIGETLGAKAHLMGMREVAVIVRGVGSGREAAIRSFVAKGINITSIKDATPVPFNGPKSKKPRRV
jgi:small subunit ribosomal protein S11